MRKLLLVVTVVFFLNSCINVPIYNLNSDLDYPPGYYSPDTLLLSDWGYDEVDSTDSLQKALDSNYKTIIIPVKPGPWITRPLFINRNNLTIIFEHGAQLIAKRGSFLEKGDSLLSINASRNISIHGYGGIMKMWREDYDRKPYEHSEWRHGIKILSSDSINIAGLTIQDTGGDGVYISGIRIKDLPLNSSNITIRDMELKNNYRQGISVISAQNLIIDNCFIHGTKGTLPEAGIDFEPNKSTESFINCKVRNCYITQNNGAGILIWLKRLDTDSTSFDITIENCIVLKNGWGLGLYLGGLKNNPPGNLYLINNEIGFINLLPKKSVNIIKL